MKLNERRRKQSSEENEETQQDDQQNEQSQQVPHQPRIMGRVGNKPKESLASNAVGPNTKENKA